MAAVADVLAVLVFAAVGRGSHAEALDAAGLSGTAAPFVAGLLVGWLAGRAWRAPTRMRTGAVVWVGATVIGLALRAALTHRLPPTFVLITAVSLAVLLFGWRGITFAVRHARPRTTSEP
jgi:hypothetical protein